MNHNTDTLFTITIYYVPLITNFHETFTFVTIRRSFPPSDSLYSAQNTHRRLDLTVAIARAFAPYYWLFESIEYFVLNFGSTLAVTVALQISESDVLSPPFFSFFCNR